MKRMKIRQSPLTGNECDRNDGVLILTKKEFQQVRKNLGKTQKEMAKLLGISIKTVHSYEQGWRTIPQHIEKHVYFLLINQRGRTVKQQPCWELTGCPCKEKCPAWEFQSGHLCWLLSGTLCDCHEKEIDDKDKLSVCKECDIFLRLFL